METLRLLLIKAGASIKQMNSSISKIFLNFILPIFEKDA